MDYHVLWHISHQRQGLCVLSLNLDEVVTISSHRGWQKWQKGFLRRAIKDIWISHVFAETLTLRALNGNEKLDFPGATMLWGSHANRDALVESPCLWVTPAQNPDMWLNVTPQPCHFPSRGPKHFKHRWVLPCLLPEFLTSEFFGHNKWVILS